MKQPLSLYLGCAAALCLNATFALAADTTKPTVPTNVAATTKSNSAITVSWNKSTDNVGVTGYRVTRNDGKVYTTSNLNFVNSALNPATNYTYTVKAFDAAGNTSAASAGKSSRTWGPGFADKYTPGHYALLYPWETPAGKWCAGKNNYTSSVELQVCRLKDNGADITNSHLKGVQARYYWKDLETSEGVFDLTPILNDLAYLESVGLRMVLAPQDIKWNSTSGAVPAYIRNLANGGGGVFIDKDTAKPKRYNDAVSARIQAFYRALGSQLDGRASLEAVTLMETSLGVKNADPTTVADYRAVDYLRETKELMLAAKQAFPKTNVIIFANYFDKDTTGANLCGDNVYAESYLDCLARYGKNVNVGLGGPDIQPNNVSLQNKGEKYYPVVKGLSPLGAAVQIADYVYAKNNGYTASDILAWSVNAPTLNLGLNYVFWLATLRTDKTNDLEFLDDVWPLMQPSAPVPPINVQ